MTATLLALEALIEFIAVRTPQPSCNDINEELRRAKSTLIPTTTVVSLLTEQHLVALLECPADMPHTLDLFMQAILSGYISPLQQVTAIRRHLFYQRRTGRWAEKPRLLQPTCEYLDMLLTLAPSFHCLVIATRARIQTCRLLLAISLHHSSALEWLKLITRFQMSGTGYVKRDMHDNVIGISTFIYIYILLHAKKCRYEAFVSMANERYEGRYLTNVNPWWPRLPCPFASSRLCCSNHDGETH